jgi:hypothetical protein
MQHQVKLIEVVKNTTSKFSFYQDSTFFFDVYEKGGKDKPLYRFSVPVEDIGTTRLMSEYNTIQLMRWVRSSIKSENFIILG